jgi:hypothetical protein
VRKQTGNNELDLPTSLDFVGRTAFIITLNGEV